MTFTAKPEEVIQDDPDSTQADARDIQGILASLRMVRTHGGHGTVSIILKDGKIYETKTEITWRPPKENTRTNML
jgi:hypothetical protein